MKVFPETKKSRRLSAINILLICVIVCSVLTYRTQNDTRTDAAVTQPAAMLIFNEQNVGLLKNAPAGLYDGLPTQAGLYQINVEYEEEAAKFTYYDNEKRSDPMIYLMVDDLPSFSIQNYPYIAVCYKSTASRSDGRFYFATKENQGLGEDKAADIKLPKTDQWKVAYVRAGNLGTWNGHLSELRFDIAGSDFTGAFYVKWIAFFAHSAEVQAFEKDSEFTANRMTLEKTEFARGEEIKATVNTWQKDDWVILVQKGDCCFSMPKAEKDLYVREVLPLYTSPISSDGTVSVNYQNEGIFCSKLLPPGEYDLIYCLNGKYVEMNRQTIRITDEIVSEPSVTEIPFVTRKPATPTPEPTEIPVETETPYEPEETRAPRTATPAKTDETVIIDNSARNIILIVASALVLAASGIYLAIAVRKKRNAR